MRTRERRRLLKPAVGTTATTVIEELEQGLRDVQRAALQLATPATRGPIASLFDDSGGSASDAIAELPDLTDSPASADALRDDLTANWQPVIADAIASLTAKVNAIIEVLRLQGDIKR